MAQVAREDGYANGWDEGPEASEARRWLDDVYDVQQDRELAPVFFNGRHFDIIPPLRDVVKNLDAFLRNALEYLTKNGFDPNYRLYEFFREHRTSQHARAATNTSMASTREGAVLPLPLHTRILS
ncbi:hypothetical protein MKEN_00763600 [Mycena kentingensis (nom. inval.)]|nr:hypothetical protein MKEN_00763600 [Mycena kentingensis (nom. inval.)]